MPAPRSPFHSTAFIRFSRRKRGYNITGLERGAGDPRIPGGAARRGANNAQRGRSRRKRNAHRRIPPPRLSSGNLNARRAPRPSAAHRPIIAARPAARVGTTEPAQLSQEPPPAWCERRPERGFPGPRRRSPQGGCTRSRADRLTALRWSGLYGTPAATDDALKRFDNSQGIMSQGIMSQGEPRD
jgi:hypothetical protein